MKHSDWIEKKEKGFTYYYAEKDADFKGVYTGTLYRKTEGSMGTEFFGTCSQKWQPSGVGLETIQKGLGKYFEDLNLYQRDFLPDGKWQQLDDVHWQVFCKIVDDTRKTEQYKEKGYIRKNTDILIDCWNAYKSKI